MLLLADDATRLRLHEVALYQAAGRVLRRAVENLRLAAYCSNLAAVLVVVVVVVVVAAPFDSNKLAVLIVIVSAAPILTSNIRHFILLV